MNILIYGSQDFGSIIKQLVIDVGHTFSGFIDDFNEGHEIIGNYEAAKQQFSPQDAAIIIAIGYKHLAARWQIYQKILEDGYTAPTLIHPQAYIANPNLIGNGAIVMARAIVDIRTNIGALATIWPGAIINHDAVIGTNSFLSPGAIVCGFSSIGEHSFIGAGAVVTDHCAVPSGSFVKAGKLYC